MPLDLIFTGGQTTSATGAYRPLELTFFLSGEDTPMLWSDENPYLYDVDIMLSTFYTARRQNETFVQFERFRVGFRRVQIKDSQVYLNGEPVVIRGVNRHEHFHDIGKCFDYNRCRDDIILLKKYNFNAIRTCHYPNDIRFYEHTAQLPSMI